MTMRLIQKKKKSYGGLYNGYVAIKKELYDLVFVTPEWKMYAKSKGYNLYTYDNTLLPEPHGGITLLELSQCPEIMYPLTDIPANYIGNYVIAGFDTGHSGDTSDKWTYEAVKEETLNWLEKIKAMINSKETLNYKFEVPIGDWSGDGHGICDWYIIKSSHPVREVREMFFNACEKAGYDFTEEFCSEYKDHTITLEQFKKIPFDISIYADDEEWWITPDEFIKLFLRWITYYNPEFNWEIEVIPMLPFYGFDEKKRHINHIGYGLFSW